MIWIVLIFLVVFLLVSKTGKNIIKIEDLRNKIIVTLGLISIYRLGSFVVLPGINPSLLSALQAQAEQGLLGLLNLFTGGAFAQASIFALGIMPYISASIVIQLMTIAVPYLQKLQKEGESGRRKINNLTRYLTIAITSVQAPGYIANLYGTLPSEAFLLPKGAFIFSSSCKRHLNTLISNSSHCICTPPKTILKFIKKFISIWC